LKIRARSALVLFSGTDLGLEPAVRSLNTLSQAGWRFEVRRTNDARTLITPDRLSALGGDALVSALHEPGDRPEKVDTVLTRHGVILVPTLSIALAARIALGLSDDEVARLICGAVERGGRVIAARDGCCPAARDRRARNLTANAPYRAMMGGHLEKLESYGVELAWASKLETAAAAPRMSSPAGLPAHTSNSHPSAPSGAPGATAHAARVLGWSEVKAATGPELRLARNVLVTPLAAEELKARQIRLVRE
jgi:hypothetical protein